MIKKISIVKDDGFSKILIYLGAIVGLFAIEYLVLHISLYVSILFSLLPAIVIVLSLFIKKPSWLFGLIFLLNYFLMGLTRYFMEQRFEPGVIMILLLIGLFFILLINSLSYDPGWKYAKNPLTLLTIIWTLYCLLEIFNLKMGSTLSWLLSLRSVALYFFFFSFFTFLFFHRYKDLKGFIFFWSVLTLIAVLKAWIQKTYGFDTAEKYWLYVTGGATTHLLYSGVRYFSIFTDAANFGCNMAFAAVVFSIASYFVKKKSHKIYLFVVSLIAIYGMLISGTRTAIAIPFVGYAVFVVLSRNKKISILALILLLGSLYFLAFTNHLQGNTYIRRARTAFHSDEDASYIARTNNKKTFRNFMADKPFGFGVGATSSSKNVTAETIEIPTDSWLVRLWVETGIVGLCLYVGIFLLILGRGAYLICFKIKNPELRGLESALVAGIAGMLVAAYANEVFAQFPNGPLIYISTAFIFMAKDFDREIEEKKTNKEEGNENAA